MFCCSYALLLHHNDVISVCMQIWFYCIYISANSSQQTLSPFMINYFEFQLPDINHPHDWLQLLYAPQYDLHHEDSLQIPTPALTQEEQRKIQHQPTPIHPLFADYLESEGLPFDEILQNGSSDVSQKEEAREVRVRNQTKNIPKNFGKGIISFIEKNERKVRALLRQQRVPYSCFIEMMREQKRSINTILDLRRLWTHEVYGKCLRVISNLFFRRHALHYIFNSRISNYGSHVKYRQSLWRAIGNPHDFNRIKQF